MALLVHLLLAPSLSQASCGDYVVSHPQTSDSTQPHQPPGQMPRERPHPTPAPDQHPAPCPGPMCSDTPLPGPSTLATSVSVTVQDWGCATPATFSHENAPSARLTEDDLTGFARQRQGVYRPPRTFPS